MKQTFSFIWADQQSTELLGWFVKVPLLQLKLKTLERRKPSIGICSAMMLRSLSGMRVRRSGTFSGRLVLLDEVKPHSQNYS